MMDQRVVDAGLKEIAHKKVEAVAAEKERSPLGRSPKSG